MQEFQSTGESAVGIQGRTQEMQSVVLGWNSFWDRTGIDIFLLTLPAGTKGLSCTPQ